MIISNIKKIFLFHTTLLSLIVGWAGAALFYYVLPQHSFAGYPLIPVYFFLFGLLEISIFDVCRKNAPQKLLMLYMGMKSMKMLISVIFLAVYCLAVREEAIVFLMTFVVYYIIYLIYETWFFFTYEVMKKQNKKNDNETNA